MSVRKSIIACVWPRSPRKSDSEGEVRRKYVSLVRLHCGHSHRIRISSLLCSSVGEDEAPLNDNSEDEASLNDNSKDEASLNDNSEEGTNSPGTKYHKSYFLEEVELKWYIKLL